MSASILSSEPIAFRCTRCFNTNCSSSDLQGQEFQCVHCSEPLTVPEATPERIKQALEILESNSGAIVSPTATIDFSAEISDADIYREARMDTRSKSGPEGLVCSRMRRFLASMIDGFAVIGVVLASILTLHVMNVSSANVVEKLNAMILVIGFVPLAMLQLVQWVLVATEGRTIGKYCLNIKIVNLQNQPPGILQGIVLRSWLTGLLGLVPFFSLIDAFVIFSNESNRCIHDFYSGTFVIEAS